MDHADLALSRAHLQGPASTRAALHLHVGETPRPRIRITAARLNFVAETHPGAPETVAAFMRLLPYLQKLIHVRWNGESV